jgi:hypothetical protein
VGVVAVLAHLFYEPCARAQRIRMVLDYLSTCTPKSLLIHLGAA